MTRTDGASYGGREPNRLCLVPRRGGTPRRLMRSKGDERADYDLAYPTRTCGSPAAGFCDNVVPTVDVQYASFAPPSRTWRIKEAALDEAAHRTDA